MADVLGGLLVDVDTGDGAASNSKGTGSRFSQAAACPRDKDHFVLEYVFFHMFTPLIEIEAGQGS
jgi:hypothetical protein